MTHAPRIARLDSAEPQFWSQLASLVAWEQEERAEVESAVRAILDAVRARGDAALLELTNRLDRRAVGSVAELRVPPPQLEHAYRTIPAPLRAALDVSAERIRAFHERQKESSWYYEEPEEDGDDGAPGTLLGQQIVPIERVGIYVPGGKAAYPSSVLMNALPAAVAGVDEVVMVVPAPQGALSPAVLAAAYLAGVDQVFTVGGAQAVAALAYGTETFPRVDKIVGPGNVYVATAKRMVFGRVGIDMVAGPSEILVVADGSVPAEWAAVDLFSQAEHDEEARAVLVSPDPDHIDAVEREIERLLPQMGRATTIRAALERHGALLRVRDLNEAIEVANFIAPEHLELAVADAEKLLPRVRHAGAVFLGRYASEVLGDYCAGPNHVLPTGRTARFSSPLGVYDFQKRTSVVRCSPRAADELGRVAAELARAEGLDAHARSAELRLGGNEPGHQAASRESRGGGPRGGRERVG